jgi:hypothetical protein
MSTTLVTRTSRNSMASTGVVVSVQTGGTKETYLRGVCKTLGDVEATVKAMLADPAAHTIGKTTNKTFRRGGHNRKKAPAIEEEQIPGAVAATVHRALDETPELAAA